MIINLVVTQEDIWEGRTHNCSHCPVALALKRAVGAVEVFVGLNDASFETPEGRFITKSFPQHVRQFIAAFDNGFSVDPFEAQLEATRR